MVDDKFTALDTRLVDPTECMQPNNVHCISITVADTQTRGRIGVIMHADHMQATKSCVEHGIQSAFAWRVQGEMQEGKKMLQSTKRIIKQWEDDQPEPGIGCPGVTFSDRCVD